jgi:hypothetical protein
LQNSDGKKSSLQCFESCNKKDKKREMVVPVVVISAVAEAIERALE